MNNYVTGATIRQLRETRGMTQAELAERIGVSAKTVSKWETYFARPVLENTILTLFNADTLLPARSATTRARLTAIRRSRGLMRQLIFTNQERLGHAVIQVIPGQNLIIRTTTIGIEGRI